MAREIDVFERYLERTDGRAPFMIRDALIEVADTALGCLEWFRAQKLEPTADAVVAMTRLVLDQAHRHRDDPVA